MNKELQDLLKQFRDIGFSEKQSKQIVKLKEMYDEENVYRRIGNLNRQAFGIEIRPTNITPTNISNRIQNDKNVKPDDIIKEYKDEFDNYKQGTTTDIQNYITDLCNEMQEFGIFMTKELLENLMNVNKNDFNLIMDYYKNVQRYWFEHHSTAVFFVRQINEILKKYEI